MNVHAKEKKGEESGADSEVVGGAGAGVWWYGTALDSERAERTKSAPTNPRYKMFTQTFFTAGDEEQFEECVAAGRRAVVPKRASILRPTRQLASTEMWDGFKNPSAATYRNTFRYIFHKLKKGIYVSIRNNAVAAFVPFSKSNFVNEWSDRIAEPREGLVKFMARVSRDSGYGDRFRAQDVNREKNKWFANNYLLRTEFPVNETDTNVGAVRDMLEELCATREVPDVEFFFNKRDFPLIKTDRTEPYDELWDGNVPLVSHEYDSYTPVLSLSKTAAYADTLVPTCEDWIRVRYFEGKHFPHAACKTYDSRFDTPWSTKIKTAVFRGSSTGRGVTVDTNQRLKLAWMSSQKVRDECDGLPFLDCGITKWNLRPRKLRGSKELQVADVAKMPFKLVGKLTPIQQSKFRYVVHVEGHVSAFRLTTEMTMGSTILMVESKWKLWYSYLLTPYEHYVPVKADLSDLIDQIRWCKAHDAECEEIAANARRFAKKFLTKDGILDRLQDTLTIIHREVGTVAYNAASALELQFEEEMAWVMTRARFDRPHDVIPTTLMSSNKLSKVCKHAARDLGFKAAARDEFVCVKTTWDRKKGYEQVHETFVGLRAVNRVTRLVPNFVRVYGARVLNGRSGVEKDVEVVTEFVPGETLQQYVESSDEFDFEELLLLLVQLLLALEVAQRECNFVHNDVAPWNVVVRRLNKLRKVDYHVAGEMMRVRTRVVPVILDYGKTHVVIEGEHYGVINMYSSSTIQDSVTLLLTVSYSLLTRRREYLQWVMKLCNFLAGGSYRKQEFADTGDLTRFLVEHKTFSARTTENKGDLEDKTPMDLCRYVLKVHRDFVLLNPRRIPTVLVTGPFAAMHYVPFDRRHFYSDGDDDDEEGVSNGTWTRLETMALPEMTTPVMAMLMKRQLIARLPPKSSEEGKSARVVELRKRIEEMYDRSLSTYAPSESNAEVERDAEEMCATLMQDERTMAALSALRMVRDHIYLFPARAAAILKSMEDIDLSGWREFEASVRVRGMVSKATGVKRVDADTSVWERHDRATLASMRRMSLRIAAANAAARSSSLSSISSNTAALKSGA